MIVYKVSTVPVCKGAVDSESQPTLCIFFPNWNVWLDAWLKGLFCMLQ